MTGRTAGEETVHATCFTCGGRGALIRGASGLGKSDLALRCLSVGPSPLFGQPAMLVSDDRVILQPNGGVLMARAPDQIAGLLEVRGAGVFRVAYAATTQIALVVDLVARDDIERLPREEKQVTLNGVTLPIFELFAFEESAALKLLLRLNHGEDRI